MIVRFPTGNVIDGESEIQKANIGEGYIHGIEFSSDYNIHPEWIVFGGVSWQKGFVDTYPTSAQVLERRPMSRIPPLTGITGIRWKHKHDKFFAEISLKMAGKQKSLSPRDEADTQRIPPGGTPGYRSLNLRGGAKITDYLSLSGAVENLTDETYRIHGSGQNEPGTNFIFSIDWII
jgi:hemoglobin/transferrin/lactoferrin receptor protein